MSSFLKSDGKGFFVLFCLFCDLASIFLRSEKDLSITCLGCSVMSRNQGISQGSASLRECSFKKSFALSRLVFKNRFNPEPLKDVLLCNFPLHSEIEH